jgi:hypothetical protein
MLKADNHAAAVAEFTMIIKGIENGARVHEDA